jgi:hypothetical protein
VTAQHWIIHNLYLSLACGQTGASGLTTSRPPVYSPVSRALTNLNYLRSWVMIGAPALGRMSRFERDGLDMRSGHNKVTVDETQCKDAHQPRPPHGAPLGRGISKSIPR